MKHPLIGLALRLPSQKGHNLGANYPLAIRRAGGVPVMIPVGCQEFRKDYMSMLDGLILCGGGDVDPSLYGEEPIPQAPEFDLADDRAEMAAVAEALLQGKPVMGICRGMQVINVALGGSLYQDIPTQVPGAIGHRQHTQVSAAPSHGVYVAQGSCLNNILKKEEIQTNSFHHQAVKTLGKGLRVSAQAADGVIEAIEGNGGSILGFQWHPEAMAAENEDMAKVFSWFVEKCRE